MNYFCFPFILFLYTNWFPLYLMISGFLHKTENEKQRKDFNKSQISRFIKDKTGLIIDSVKISSSPKLWAAMIGIPGFPQMRISAGIINLFNEEELKYVVLHEIGHYVLGHSVKKTISLLFFTFMGLLVVNYFNLACYLAIILSLVFGLIYIRFQVLFEVEADRYALKKLNCPNTMIKATRKFMNNSALKIKSPVLKRLLISRIPYEKRIEMANKQS